jgi:hypothetical protein
LGIAVIAAVMASLLGVGATSPAATASPTCPADLTGWRTLLGAQWLDCHQLADLTTTNNPYTDPNSLTGMGFPPPGSGTVDSHYTNPTAPPVSGLQLDGYWPDGCNAFQVEPALTAKNGAPFIQGCVPPAGAGGTCASDCHHDAQFVIRIPDSWNGRLLTAGTPGIRDAFASDFILSDAALERHWAYVAQDKGNLGANFYRDGADETACATAWCPAAAIAEWNHRMRQATRSAKALLNSLAPSYGLNHVTRSYAAGISNGGYQVRRALETDTRRDTLYDGGVDWEGTLFSQRSNLFDYLPTSIVYGPDAIAGVPSAISAMAAVGFNPESQPLWAYHYNIYWGLTQKVYRLEIDPEYTSYTCSGTGGPCVSPAAEVVPPTDPDAAYKVNSRQLALTRIQSIANTGNIQHPLITLHGDQDALLPIKTDSDVYARMVAAAGHANQFRYYTVRGGNHVDPQFDDHYGVDSYGNTLLRPVLPCVWAALDAEVAWVEKGTAPPASHTIARPSPDTAADLANNCSLV